MNTTTIEFPVTGYENEESNLIVLPDLNGRLDAFRNCLLAMNLIEPETGKPTEFGIHDATRVVQAGDILGYNRETLRILDAIVELRRAGMHIGMVYGNHEARMVAALQEKDKTSPLHINTWMRTADGINMFEEMVKVRGIARNKVLTTLCSDIFDDNGRYNELLGPEHAKALTEVKNTIITHAAPDEQWLDRYIDHGEQGVNIRFRSLLFDPNNLSAIATKNGSEAAILWNNVHEPNMYPEVQMRRLREKGIEHMVHGHKQLPQHASSIQSANMMLHGIDTGIGNHFGSDVTVFYSNGNGTSHCISGEYAGIEA